MVGDPDVLTASPGRGSENSPGTTWRSLLLWPVVGGHVGRVSVFHIPREAPTSQTRVVKARPEPGWQRCHRHVHGKEQVDSPSVPLGTSKLRG